MVCEVASSGREALIVRTDHKTRRRPKRSGVYPEIMRHASVEWYSAETLQRRIRLGSTKSPPVKSLRDTEVAAAAVVRMLEG